MCKHHEARSIFNVLEILVIAAAILPSTLPVLLAAPPGQETQQPWMNTRLSPDKRADLLLEQLTLDEKIQIVHGLPGFDLPAFGSFKGMKKVPGALGGDGFAPGIPRLGIPDLQLIGAGVGVTDLGRRPNGQSTALPSSLCETSSWDLKVAYDFGTVIGKETRDEGFNVSLGGGTDLTREPRNGRNFEYHGEDPLLAGKILGRELKAIQDQGVVADIKHYAVNDQETGRNSVSSNLDKRSLRESDLLAFEIAIKDSDVGTVMCAYNRVNGDYSCENSYLLNDVLKKDWGFKGWVMSDWGATHSTVKAALAGLDQEMPTGVHFGASLKATVEKSEVAMSRLNDMVHRILRTMFAFGVIDNPPVIKPIDVEAGAAVAQRVAEQGIVLLKNAGGQLPLNASSIHTIAIIGSHADVGVLSGGGSAQVNPVGGNAVPPKGPPTGPLGFLSVQVWDPSSPLKAIRAKVPKANVQYDSGTDFTAAAKLAVASDVAIVFVHQHTSEGADVPSLSLPDNQDQLVIQVAAANPHTIVVLETGGAVLMPWINSVRAALEAWYSGARGGEAIANILFGDVNPSGKLPVTFPKIEADLPHPILVGPPPVPPKPPAPGPPSSGETQDIASFFPPPVFFDVNYTEGLKVGYKWYDAENKEPLFPFGFGLSYTTFSYSRLKIDSGKHVRVTFDVENTGSRAGAEIAQVYLGLPASAGEPPKRLAGWEKANLAPGEKQRITVTIDPNSNSHPLSIFNPDKDAWETVSGEHIVYVGGSSRDIHLTGTPHFAATRVADLQR